MDFDFPNWLWIMLAFFIFMSMAKGGHISRQQRKLQDRIDKLQAAPPPPPAVANGPSREDVARLEQRVRVLERIVTDSGYTLASQIEALRDDRRVEPRLEARQEEEKI